MSLFELIVETDPQPKVVRLRLLDEHGVHQGAQAVKLTEHPASVWEGLFNTRGHVRRYANDQAREGAETPAALLARLGTFLGTQVLGTEILTKLAAGIQHRTLLVRLPDAASSTPW